MRTLAILIACNALFACSEDAPPPMRTKTFGGARPADLKVPEPFTEGRDYPLIVILHGFGASGFVQYAYFGMADLVTRDQALVIAPDGTENGSGMQFWNADPACCDFEGRNPDDVAYIGGLIDAIVAEWPVGEVYIVGHSNGGYMAYRMACARADAIAGIASLAGNAASIASSCNPTRPVSVLHMHGTLDATVPFAGTYGAVASVGQWATHDGCGTTRTPTVTLDLDSSVAGSETRGEIYGGCPASTSVELWTMEGSGHIPAMQTTFAATVLDWFQTH
jgi:polyhydroxybutyrate depolymerase